MDSGEGSGIRYEANKLRAEMKKMNEQLEHYINEKNDELQQTAASQTLLINEQTELLKELKAQLESRTEARPAPRTAAPADKGASLVPALATTPDKPAAPAAVSTARSWFGGGFLVASGAESARPANPGSKPSSDPLAA